MWRSRFSTLLKTTVFFSRVEGIFFRDRGSFSPVVGIAAYIWARPGSNDYFSGVTGKFFPGTGSFFPSVICTGICLSCCRIIVLEKPNSSCSRLQIEHCQIAKCKPSFSVKTRLKFEILYMRKRLEHDLYFLYLSCCLKSVFRFNFKWIE